MVRELVEGGKPPDEIADIVFDAVRTGRFYVLPHPELAERVLDRAQWIADGAPPPLPEL
jgi:hypothetical protein